MITLNRRSLLRTFALISLAAVLRCGPPSAPRAAVPPPPAGGRAVLISFDGLAGARLERMLGNSSKLPLSAFRRLAERGFHAVRSHPPTPSLTAVSHIVHVTGALPQVTGIVSNSMLDRMKPFGATISGFDAPIRAETLWEAARRQGKRVGVMLYPGADGNGPARTADWMMTWPGEPLVPGRLWTIPRSAWVPVTPGGANSRSFSPVVQRTLVFGETAFGVVLQVADTTDDGWVNYDRVFVRGTEGGKVHEVRVGEWFP
ncbi:MAG TPA: alkaline phosphatase family protein, partial [Thermoanaerobaculia bacterium]|nr:alkaline phosphatase family protein [Thermoanaerobaculia bacterium]